MGAGGGLREGALVCYRSFVVCVIGRIAWRLAPDSFWEGRWPEVCVGGLGYGEILARDFRR